MCHQKVQPNRTGAEGDPETDAIAGEDNQNNNGTPEEPLSNEVTPDDTEQQKEDGERETTEDGADGKEDDRQPAEPDRKAAQGLRFSSNGDFVGFVNSTSEEGRDELSCFSKASQNNVFEEGSKELPPPLPSEETPEDHCDCEDPRPEDSVRVEPFNMAKNDTSCDCTEQSCSGLCSTELNNGDNRTEGCLT